MDSDHAHQNMWRKKPAIGLHRNTRRASATYRKCRAFLAQWRGHHRAVVCKLLIRAGGLKTCWTKPPGTVVPQLWALQLGQELRRPEKAAANKEERQI